MAIPVDLSVNNRIQRIKEEKESSGEGIKSVMHKEGLLFCARWEGGNE